MATPALILQRVLVGVLVVCSRLRAFFSQTHGLHTARFATLHELTGLITHTLDDPPAGGSLLLGISHFNQVLRVRPTSARREFGNMLVVAPTRSGKGLLATSQLLSFPHSVIVNDVKGELFAHTAGYRSRANIRSCGN